MTSEAVFGVYFKIKTLRWNFDHVKLYFFFCEHNMTDIRVFVVNHDNKVDRAIVRLKKLSYFKGEFFDYAILNHQNYQLILDSVRCKSQLNVGIQREGLIFEISNPNEVDAHFYEQLYNDDVVALFK